MTSQPPISISARLEEAKNDSILDNGYTTFMGRGGREHKAIADQRLSAVPRATSFIELYGQMIETSEIDCKIPGATIQINELPEAPEEIRQIQDIAGISDEFAGQRSFEGTLNFPEDQDTTLELITHQPTRSLALSTVLAAEKNYLKDGSFSGPVETKVLSYPSEHAPAMIWAEAIVPEIGHFSLMTSANNLSLALARLQEVVPQAKMPS